MKKRYIVALILAVVLAVAGTGVSYALMSDASDPVINTFTYGKINIELLESSGNEYMLIPGVTHAKDPHVIVKKDSEACWLFCKVETTERFDECVEYEIDGGWILLDKDSNVYWREVDEVYANTAIRIIKDDLVTVKDSVTEEMLAKLDVNHEMKIKAYAIQRSGIDDPEEAWHSLMKLQE